MSRSIRRATSRVFLYKLLNFNRSQSDARETDKRPVDETSTKTALIWERCTHDRPADRPTGIIPTSTGYRWSTRLLVVPARYDLARRPESRRQIRNASTTAINVPGISPAPNELGLIRTISSDIRPFYIGPRKRKHTCGSRDSTRLSCIRIKRRFPMTLDWRIIPSSDHGVLSGRLDPCCSGDWRLASYGTPNKNESVKTSLSVVWQVDGSALGGRQSCSLWWNDHRAGDGWFGTLSTSDGRRGVLAMTSFVLSIR